MMIKNNRLEGASGDEKGLDFIEFLIGFEEFGVKTKIESVSDVTYFINEFWTSKQRQAARIHEISYRACFKPQLPAFFIDRLSELDDVVYDPFMGRGTTPIEAALKGRTPYGNDINPLSRAFVEPRINPPSLIEIARRLELIPWDEFTNVESDDLLTFFHPKTLAQIEGLRSWFLDKEVSGELDVVDKWIRMVTINRLTGHSSGFLSVYTLPPNQAVSIERQKKINIKREQKPPQRDVKAIILKKSKSLLNSASPSASRQLFSTDKSFDSVSIPDNSVTLTVTSPPFLNIVSYEDDNWLRCWFLGVDAKKIQIAKYSKVEDWQNFIKDTLVELERVTKPGGHIVFEVGEVRNGKVKLELAVIDALAETSLELLGVMINQQEFTKTSNCWGVSNNTGGTNSNRIVLIRKGYS